MLCAGLCLEASLYLKIIHHTVSLIDLYKTPQNVSLNMQACCFLRNKSLRVKIRMMPLVFHASKTDL